MSVSVHMGTGRKDKATDKLNMTIEESHLSISVSDFLYVLCTIYPLLFQFQDLFLKYSDYTNKYTSIQKKV